LWDVEGEGILEPYSGCARDEEVAMEAPADRKELKTLRENVSRIVQSLELCWGCERICQCEQWIVKQEVALWLCKDCLSSVSRRLEKQAGDPVSLVSAAPRS
jgi:hypothetical protein